MNQLPHLREDLKQRAEAACECEGQRAIALLPVVSRCGLEWRFRVALRLVSGDFLMVKEQSQLLRALLSIS